MDPDLVFFLRYCVIVLTLAAQTPDVPPTGTHATAPRLLHKTEPEYSPQARADHVQGTVVYQLYVDERGRPTDITVISPLGFGLDERGAAAIAKWRFAPGQKDGKPIRVRATVEVRFRFPQIWFDETTEKRRTSYNLAIENSKQKEPKSHDLAVKSIQDLAAQAYPPAMYMLGAWETSGENVDRNANDGFRLIQQAADKNYGPALYAVAHRQLESHPQPSEASQALDNMREAAVLGSAQAQYYLGQIYDKGAGVTADAGRARRYFRLCATRGLAECQVRLGALMLRQPDAPDYDYEQAIAWLQLAADQDLPEARQLANQEEAKLSAAQLNAVTHWKAQLQPRP